MSDPVPRTQPMLLTNHRVLLRVTPRKLTYRLTTPRGTPVPYAYYRATLPGGEKVQGYLDRDGFVEFRGVGEGPWSIHFPDLFDHSGAARRKLAEPATT